MYLMMNLFGRDGAFGYRKAALGFGGVIPVILQIYFISEYNMSSRPLLPAFLLSPMAYTHHGVATPSTVTPKQAMPYSVAPRLVREFRLRLFGAAQPNSAGVANNVTSAPRQLTIRASLTESGSLGLSLGRGQYGKAISAVVRLNRAGKSRRGWICQC